MKSRTILFVYSFIFSLVPLWSQSPEESQYQFQVMGWNRNQPDMFYLQDGNPVLLRLNMGLPSPIQSIPGPENLNFYIPVETGEGIIAQPLVEVTLQPPPALNLVVIWLNKAGEYQSAVLRDDPEDHVPGTLRVVNFSGKSLRAQFNSDPIQDLVEGETKIVIPENEGVGVKIAVKHQSNNKWKMGLLTGLTVRKTDRVTAFLADPSMIAPTLAQIKSNVKSDEKPLSLFVIRN